MLSSAFRLMLKTSATADDEALGCGNLTDQHSLERFPRKPVPNTDDDSEEIEIQEIVTPVTDSMKGFSDLEDF